MFVGGDGPAVLFESGLAGGERPQLCVSHWLARSGPCQMIANFCECFPKGGLRWNRVASSIASSFSSSVISSSVLERCTKLRTTAPVGWQSWFEEPNMCHLMATEGSSA